MITFTPEQQKTVDYILEQVEAGGAGKNVIVSGQGGVGKTEMVCELVCILLLRGYKVAVSAMTGKATSVLREKINRKIWENGIKDKFPKENLLIDTVQKITKESKVLGTTESGETLYSNTWKKPENFGYDVLIIDELSMVPHFVSQWWQRTNARVIGLGDFCQLPEVITRETQKELAGFRHDLKLPESKMITGYGIKVLKDLAQCQLTKVLRSDNEIALLCNDLRDFTMSKRQIIETIKKWADRADCITYSTNLSDLETSKDWQIICYTNKRCHEINNQLCIGNGYPDLDDKILLCDNLNPIHKYNGETMLFKELLTAINKYNSANAARKIFVCFKWQGQMPKKDSPHVQERTSFQAYVQFKRQQEMVNTRRMMALPDIIQGCHFIAEDQKKEWIEEIRQISRNNPNPNEAFNEIVTRFQDIDLDVAQYIMDRIEPAPRLYMVNLDYGYAITTHKSQGSEYPNVCYLLEKFDKPLLYTGASRAKQKLKIINLTKEV